MRLCGKKRTQGAQNRRSDPVSARLHRRRRGAGVLFGSNARRSPLSQMMLCGRCSSASPPAQHAASLCQRLQAAHPADRVSRAGPQICVNACPRRKGVRWRSQRCSGMCRRHAQQAENWNRAEIFKTPAHAPALTSAFGAGRIRGHAIRRV